MPFQACLTILICLLLGVSGCMKAVAPPLRAFSGYLEGHRVLLQGDFPRALSLLNRSLQDNAESPGYPPYVWAAFMLTGKY